MSTFSIGHTAETMGPTLRACPNLFVADCARMDGQGMGTFSGKREQHPEIVSFMTSHKLHPKSNIVSLKDIKVSLKGSHISNASSQQRLEVIDRIYYGGVNADYNEARRRARQWEEHIYCTYTKIERLSIMGMLAYLENVERGLCECNHEEGFLLARKDDSSGQLFDEALWGLAFSKEYIMLAPLVIDLKSRGLIPK